MSLFSVDLSNLSFYKRAFAGYEAMVERKFIKENLYNYKIESALLIVEK
jgi:hypothetical protein